MSAALLFKATRCHARSKRTGEPCCAAAVPGWKVCRHHGAGGGAPKGERNGNYKNGLHTRAAVADRRMLTAFLKLTRSTLAEM